MTARDGAVHVSVVSPVYGCRECLEQLVDGVETALRSRAASFEVVLVDDGSPDGAWAAIQALTEDRSWLTGVRLSRNFGQHPAIDAGLRQASGDWIVVMDCDLQDPPSAIPQLLDKAINDGYDVVFAQRQNRQDKASKRLSSWAFYRLLSWLTGVPQDASSANFGVFNRSVIDVVTQMPERDKAFPLMVRWAGFRIGYQPVEHAARAHGSTSYSLGRLIRLGTQIVLGYSDKPLRMVAVGGMACSLVSFLMAALSVLLFFNGHITVAGYTSLMASVWLLGGLVLFSVGVVGLYVGQVFANVQGRPPAVIAEVVGGD